MRLPADPEFDNRYLFGDSDIATQRLKLLAEIFAEATKGFLTELPDANARCVIDLGCGPGHTTRLLVDRYPNAKVIGLDNSARFLAIASRQLSGVSFQQHDVTRTPFPSGSADVLYCRFLLTHVVEPLAVIEKWVTQIQPPGQLIIEETDWIETANPVLKNYLDIVEAMMSAQGNHLYIGPLVDRIDVDLLTKHESGVTKVWVSAPQNALLYLLNLQVWRHCPFVRDNYSSRTIDELQMELQRLASGATYSADVEYGIRQVLFLRSNS